MSRFFSTISRHSHSAKGNNLNHLHGYKAPDKSMRYINRPVFRKGAPVTFPSAQYGPIYTPPIRSTHRSSRIHSIPENIIYAGPYGSTTNGVRMMTTSTQAPVHGLSSDGANNTKSINQMDNEGWVDPEEMPTLSTFARNATPEYDDAEMQPSSTTRRKNKAGTASALPTDAEASLSADKQDMNPQELVRETTKKIANRKQKFSNIAEDEQPIRDMNDDSDITSHSTQGRVGISTSFARTQQGQDEYQQQEKPSKQSMMGNKTKGSGKLNEDISHPAAYGTNSVEGNIKPKMKKNKGSDEWSA